MIHIYHGSGKGKTTAGIGLSVRAAAHGVPVLFVQFLKDASSGEIQLLREIKDLSLLHPERSHGFVFQMSPEQIEDTKIQYRSMLAEIIQRAEEFGQGEKKEGDIRGLLVLDEVLHALHKGLLEERALLEWMEALPEDIEVVLTGRNPSEALLAVADYVTDFVKEKHPFDLGIPAREGVEL